MNCEVFQGEYGNRNFVPKFNGTIQRLMFQSVDNILISESKFGTACDETFYCFPSESSQLAFQTQTEVLLQGTSFVILKSSGTDLFCYFIGTLLMKRFSVWEFKFLMMLFWNTVDLEQYVEDDYQPVLDSVFSNYPLVPPLLVETIKFPQKRTP